ncbi:MAG: pseudouridine synthase [Candidatus Wallbacteria bacterium]|nr:pseudouridine synthase [Candidatus Wallbacteria bacterium]
MIERLQKIISRAGVCSRRRAEELIAEGKVTVDGLAVTEQGCKADPSVNVISVDGKKLEFQDFVYLLLYKPRNMLTTLDDPRGRPTIMDCLRPVKQRVFPVGRLDFDAEGLIFLTNHGELANRLIHPRYKALKTYQVRVTGHPREEDLDKIRRGIGLPEFKAQPAQIKIIEKNQSTCWLELKISEGKYHQVKLMCEGIGTPVEKIVRTGFAFFTLGGLEPGRFRHLTLIEIERLLKSTGLTR